MVVFVKQTINQRKKNNCVSDNHSRSSSSWFFDSNEFDFKIIELKMYNNIKKQESFYELNYDRYRKDF